MPANARIALPVFMALLVYVIYHGVGVIAQGPISYLKNTCSCRVCRRPCTSR